MTLFDIIMSLHRKVFYHKDCQEKGFPIFTNSKHKRIEIHIKSNLVYLVGYKLIRLYICVIKIYQKN